MPPKPPVRLEYQTDEQYAFSLQHWEEQTACLQKLLRIYEAWRFCQHVPCRRAHGCMGDDPDRCLWAFRRMVPSDIWLEHFRGLRAEIAKTVGLDFLLGDADTPPAQDMRGKRRGGT